MASRTTYDPSDPAAYVPPTPIAPTSVASRFVSQSTLDAAKAQREADWKAAYERMGQEPPKKEEDNEPYDGRSLWEKLKANKDKKQEAFDEQLKFKNQFRALDEDEISFLDSLTEDNHEEEDRKKQMIDEEVKNFRAAVSKQSGAPPPSVSPSLSLSAPGPSTSAPTSIAAPQKKPAAASKKKDFQKKFLAGVVVKKKGQEDKKASSTSASPVGGVKRSASTEGSPVAKETGSSVDAKKRKVEGA
ncbi:hypothetical protein T439DRAFT_380583 [Meredithblackwellia eburnea MCA 4105]